MSGGETMSDRFHMKTIVSFGQESYILMDSQHKENSYQTDNPDLARAVLQAMNSIGVVEE